MFYSFHRNSSFLFPCLYLQFSSFFPRLLCSIRSTTENPLKLSMPKLLWILYLWSMLCEGNAKEERNIFIYSQRFYIHWNLNVQCLILSGKVPSVQFATNKNLCFICVYVRWTPYGNMLINDNTYCWKRNDCSFSIIVWTSKCPLVWKMKSANKLSLAIDDCLFKYFL